MDYFINGKIKKIQIFPKICLYFLFGSLWSFSNVGYSFAFLTWFTFIPFIVTIKYEDNKYGFFYSWVFGFAVYFFHLWWMIHPLTQIIFTDPLNPFFNILSWILAFIIYLGVCIYHGLVYSLIFIATKYLSKNDNRLFYFCIPIVTVVFDYFFPKLWYDQIGYSQYVFFHFSQIADIFGVPGISFLIICCNSAAIILIESFLYKKNINFGIMIFSIMILIIIGSSIYGIFRYKYILKISEAVQKANIGIVQGNFTGYEKRDNDNIEKMISGYNDLSIKILNKKPDLIVWPETAIPIEYAITDDNYKDIKKFSEVSLLTGIHLIEINEKKKSFDLYNSLVLISRDKKRIDYYNKRKLVPFVEKAPIPFLNIIIERLGYYPFTSGDEYKIMEVKNIKFSPNICYEGIIAGFIKNSININNKKANLIINATNDSWYGRTIEPMMHLHMTGFRAIENRISLVRATCTGYSAIFNPTGDLAYISPLFKEDVVSKEVPLLEMDTIYNKWGWLFIWFLTLFLIIIAFIATYRKSYFRYIKRKLISKRFHKRDLKRMWYE